MYRADSAAPDMPRANRKLSETTFTKYEASTSPTTANSARRPT